MVFTSSVFLFIFLPLFLAVYNLLPARARTTWMLAASYLFYGWWRLDFLALFVLTTVFTYLVGRAMATSRDVAPGRVRALLTLGVVGNLSTLAYFKYFDFGVDSLNSALRALGGEPLTAWGVVLPIGISFYVFQSVSYLVDSYRGDADGRGRFVDVAAYIALFPQLIAGPIVRYKILGPQLYRPSATLGDFGVGAKRFMIGFCKKVLIADTVAPIADAAFALSSPTVGEAWLGAVAFGVQLLFDFSGYSDMAIGLARMMGLRLLENFALPYRSLTITEFWRRWHISLSRWLRDYLYVPLGGNRRGRRRTYLNLALVMLLGGLWHGAAWTFVLWGAWHGALLVGERLLYESGGGVRLPRGLATARTLTLVTLGWVTFRAEGFAGAAAMYRGMFGVNGVWVTPELAWQLPTTGLAALAVGLLIALLLPARDPLAGETKSTGDSAAEAGREPAVTAPTAEVLASPALPRKRTRRRLSSASSRSWAGTLALLPAFLLGVLRTVADSFSPFLYFQF